MSTVAEVEKLAFDLSEKDRAKLAERLLVSLHSFSSQSYDDVIEIAMRRSRELHEDPTLGISIEELDLKILNRKK